MSDRMEPMSFGQLIKWITTEYETHHQIFSVPLHKPKYNDSTNKNTYSILGKELQYPFGPAAGPHTQMAPNIIAAYVAGARYFELKTVQVLDGPELAACIPKPCITAEDECYNCEWSTELTVEQAFEEYVKAWIICKILEKEYNLGDFIFNMSVGYDLAGIKSKKIDMFIEHMKDAGNTSIFLNSISWLLDHLDLFENVDENYLRSMDSHISNSITESTLHGCSPQEIESIAEYLITEKHLHTLIKCNPTLLGYDFVRETLDRLGYDYISFDSHHFDEDLKWEDARNIFRRLIHKAQKQNVEFALKLSNTLPVEVKQHELPSDEMYMSGKALYPLTLRMASMIRQEFGNDIRISYSGGADIHNIHLLLGAGIWPVTMATTLLKPGGYERLSHICEMMESNQNCKQESEAVYNLEIIEKSIDQENYYRKKAWQKSNNHLGKLPLFDCFTSPCGWTCPINQDIPAYLQALEEGYPDKALRIILDKNPLPFITGTICNHLCISQCMRRHYDDPVRIREKKLEAAQNGFSAFMEDLSRIKETLSINDKPSLRDVSLTKAIKCNKKNHKIAIIGGGPAGLSAAFFLARSGFPVTIFEKRETLGGIVRHVIPEFRIPTESIEKDLALCKAYGIEIKTNHQVHSIKELKKEGYEHIIVATGAWEPSDPIMKYGSPVDALDFLEKYKSNSLNISVDIKNIAVIGGGNTAIDVARAAMCLPGVEKVSLVYRRRRKDMPADEEELELALKEGAKSSKKEFELLELLIPIGLKDGNLSCCKMEVVDKEYGCKPSIKRTDKMTSIPADLVIQAIGQKSDLSWIDLDDDSVHIIGDANHGPATVVEAIADAQKAAAKIVGKEFSKYE